MSNHQIRPDIVQNLRGFFAKQYPNATITAQSVPGLQVLVGVYDTYAGSGFSRYDANWVPAFALKALKTNLGTPDTAEAQLIAAGGGTATASTPTTPTPAPSDGAEPPDSPVDNRPPLSIAATEFEDNGLLYRHEGHQAIREVQLRKGGIYCVARVPHASTGLTGNAPSPQAMYELVYAVPREGTRVDPVLLHRARIEDATAPTHIFCFFEASGGHEDADRMKLVDARQQ
ncbi:MAG: hypothetical protein AAF799_32495 [Myxococcota bacterium]